MPKCLNFWAQNSKEKETTLLCLPTAVNKLQVAFCNCVKQNSYQLCQNKDAVYTPLVLNCTGDCSLPGSEVCSSSASLKQEAIELT